MARLILSMDGKKSTVRSKLQRPHSGDAAKPDLQTILQTLGADRVQAALLGFLGHAETGTTRNIMAATGLRQPEISVGMRRLMDRGWVVQDVLAREGKGRPMHVYRRKVPIKVMRDAFMADANHQVESLQGAMEALQRSWR